MTLGRQLPPHRAVAAAHDWMRVVLKEALARRFPNDAQRVLYNDAALEQIKAIVSSVIESFEPPKARRADWD